MRWRIAGRRGLSLVLTTCLCAVALSVLPDTGPVAKAAPRSQVLLVPAIDEGPVVPGGVFFEKTITIDFSGGELLLSGDQDGSLPLFLDDILRLGVVHEDGSTATFSHDFSHDCQGSISREGPFDIHSYLEPGSNKVRVELADKCGVGASSSDIWLIGDFEVGGGVGGPTRVLLVPAIEERPVVPGGVFFEKAVTIRPSGGELLLSGDVSGTEPLFVDDILRLSIVHQDGSTATFSHDFSHDCQGFISREGPFDIQSHLEPGANDVRVELADKCGVGASSSDIWLIGDFEVGGGVGGPTRVLLVPAIEERPVVPGGVFFEKAVTIRPSGGELLLSGDVSGTEPLFVDDILRLSIVHQDGSTATFSHDFSHDCQGFISREGPFDIQSHLEPGANDVRVELADKCGVGASSSDIWLIGDFEVGGGVGGPTRVLLVPAIEERPVVPGGVFFEKAVTIRPSGGELLLSGDVSGTEPLFVDDILRLSIVHQDGSTATFSHDFSHDCQGFISREGPFDIQSHLEPGANDVRVELADKCGVGASSSDIWLIGDFQLGAGGSGGESRLAQAFGPPGSTIHGQNHAGSHA